MQTPSLLLTFIALLLSVTACNNKPSAPVAEEVVSAYADTLPGQVGMAENTAEDTTYATENYNQTMYLVIADSGSNYWQLEHAMFKLHNSTGLAIDTQGKLFNPEKGQITVAEDDEDEMWRGEYFLRRYGEDFLSLEQLASYEPNPGLENSSKTMILMAGLFSNRASADSLAAVIRPHAPGTFVMQSSIYMGCMH